MITWFNWLKTKPFGLAAAIGVLLATVIFTAHRLSEKPEPRVDALSIEPGASASVAPAPITSPVVAETVPTAPPLTVASADPALVIQPEPPWADHDLRLTGLEQDFTQVKSAVDEMQQQLKALQASVNTLSQPAPVTPAAQPATMAKKPVKKRPRKPKAVKRLVADLDAGITNPSPLPDYNAGLTIEAVNRWGDDKRVLVKSEHGYQQLQPGDALGNSTIESIQPGRIVLKNSGRQIILTPNAQGRYE